MTPDSDFPTSPHRLPPLLLAALVLLGCAGCASTPVPPAADARERLGHVGVLGLPSMPELEFRTFAKGWANGAAKGGSLGLVTGLLETLVETTRQPDPGPYGTAATLIVGVIFTTVSTTLNAVQGGIEAVPSKAADEAERQLNATFGNANMADDLAGAIQGLAASRPELARYAITRLYVPPAATAHDYGDLIFQGITTLVEVQVTEAGFRGGSGSQPEVNFYLNAHLRLLSTATGEVIYTRDFQYLGRARPFAAWFSDDAQALRAAFGESIESLSERILDELFVVTKFPFDSGLWALPGQPEFGSCWFRPLYPALDYTSLWDSIRRYEPGMHIRYTPVDSLQPVLRWEPFPRPRDLKPANAAVLARISDITYDLKIWETSAGYPARLVDDVSGLADAQYRPVLPLKPATQYFWTFRAKYRFDGQVQVTRWAFSGIPSNVPAEYPQRPPGGNCDLDAIPATNYFRFVTP